MRRFRRLLFLLAVSLSLFVLPAVLLLWMFQGHADIRTADNQSFAVFAVKGEVIFYHSWDLILPGGLAAPRGQFSASAGRGLSPSIPMPLFRETSSALGDFFAILGFDSGEMTPAWKDAGPVSFSRLRVARPLIVRRWENFCQIPIWFLTIIFSLFPLKWWVEHQREMRLRRQRLCTHCGYDLRATPDRCPECGKFADEEAVVVTQI